jgi:hypothetical protein
VRRRGRRAGAGGARKWGRRGWARGPTRLVRGAGQTPAPIPIAAPRAPTPCLPPRRPRAPRWFWQCQPPGYTSSSDKPRVSLWELGERMLWGAPRNFGVQAGSWGACGGINGPGGQDAQGADCKVGMVCVRSDRYFWQCQPASQQLESRLIQQQKEQRVREEQQKQVEEDRRRGILIVPMWGLCGGINGPGGKDEAGARCVPGAECRRLDRWGRAPPGSGRGRGGGLLPAPRRRRRAPH